MLAEQAFVFDSAAYARIAIPTLLLVGSKSPPSEEHSAKVVAAVLPSARIHVLEGQGHAAMHAAQEAIVEAIVGFLKEA
jgi:3-oxoadipate enol-lactonase